MIKIKRLFFIFFLIFFLPANFAFGANFLWSVKSPWGGEVYLLGSIHLASPKLYPLNQKITDAYYRSHNLAVEVNILNIKLKEMQDMQDKGFYPPGQDALADLSPETLALLQQSPYYTHELLVQKPWMIALKIQLAAIGQLGYDAQYGLDVHFLQLAINRKQKIFEAETFKEQLAPWQNMSIKEADLALRATLLEVADLPSLINGFWNSWQKGDTETFAALFFKGEHDYPELAAVTDKIIYQRNNKMLAFVESLARRKNEVTFIVLGAGHLVGPKGILAQLQAKGYRLQQL